MSLAHRFEDMPSWQDARRLTRQLYQLTASGPFADDPGLGERIRQAAAASMAHIATGSGHASRAEAARCLQSARHSVAEVQSLLYIALDMGYIDAEAFRALYEQAANVGALLNDLEQDG